jgi:tetratricopeptide (TPR) repeat protein
MEQGDLRGAVKLYEEALQFDRETEDTGNAAIAGYNIANLHELQGDLAGAKQGFEQSLATWQKNGDQYSSTYATWSLGGLQVQKANFSGARKMYEQTLALRTSAGDRLSIAETQLGLADLSLQEARSPVEQETAMRQVIEVFQKEKARDDEAQAWCILARALLAESNPAAAKEATHRARALAAKSQNPEIRWQTAIVAARIQSADKDVAHSVSGLAALKELTPLSRNRASWVIRESSSTLALRSLRSKSRRDNGQRDVPTSPLSRQTPGPKATTSSQTKLRHFEALRVFYRWPGLAEYLNSYAAYFWEPKGRHNVMLAADVRDIAQGHVLAVEAKAPSRRDLEHRWTVPFQ